MATVPPRARVDERAIGAGTTVRFALLIVMLVVASGSMIVDAITGFRSNSNGCLLAAGGVPDMSDALGGRIVAFQWEAFNACMARHAPSPPWWVAAVWPVAVLLAGGALFFGLSAWKARRRRVVPLETVDPEGGLGCGLSGLAVSVGLARPPRFVVDPVAASTGAVVFGRTRRPVVCLHGGLLARRHADPGRFRTVLLHEMAHIRNGDVTITYATVALWRAFLALVLVPYVGLHVAAMIDWLRAPIWASEATITLRGLAVAGVLGALVYLARSDVLRSREIHADLAARRWGADPRGWSVASPEPVGGVRGAFGSFLELWGTHPRWDLRRHTLTDPAPLFGVRALPMVLTGISATLINSQVAGYLKEFAVDGAWVRQLIQLGTAGLVTSVAGIALWRAVAHAVLTSRPAPSGVRAGLWLGGGMAVGELVTGEVAAGRPLPGHPEVLLLVVLAGAVFGWWIVQCAHLWIRAWRGRTLHAAMLIGLIPAWLGLSAWFAWWQVSGVVRAVQGWLGYNPAASRARLTDAFPGPVEQHSTTVSALVHAIPLSSELTTSLLLPLAIAAAWVVPLLAWAVRPATTAPRWARAALEDGELDEPFDGGRPPLRRALLPGLLGGLACCVAVAGVQAHVHGWRSPAPQQAPFYIVIYYAWLFVAIAVATAATAGVAAALASRYRLLLTLIAAETAVVVGFAGMGVLASAIDGCAPLKTGLWSLCAWDVEQTGPISNLLVPALATGAFAAVIMAVIASAIQAARTRTARPPAMALPDRTGTRHGLARRRACVSVLTVAATATAVAGSILWAQRNALMGKTSTETAVALAAKPPGAMPVSARIRGLQVAAWYGFVGQDIERRQLAAVRRLGALVTKAEKDPAISASLFLPICADLNRIARDADAALKIPDPQIQALWRKFITQLAAGSTDCIRAVRNLERAHGRGDYAPLNKSLDDVLAAATTNNAVLTRMAATAERALK
jgi:Zn-dependent protease with chaperone function